MNTGIIISLATMFFVSCSHAQNPTVHPSQSQWGIVDTLPPSIAAMLTAGSLAEVRVETLSEVPDLELRSLLEGQSPPYLLIISSDDSFGMLPSSRGSPTRPLIRRASILPPLGKTPSAIELKKVDGTHTLASNKRPLGAKLADKLPELPTTKTPGLTRRTIYTSDFIPEEWAFPERFPKESIASPPPLAQRLWAVVAEKTGVTIATKREIREE